VSEYQEIVQLTSLRIKHKITIHKTGRVLNNKPHYPEVLINIDSDSFKIIVDDEFDDLRYKNPELSLCLVLRALEVYHETDDYLNWCKEMNIDAGDFDAREYHMSLPTIFAEIESKVGKIDSFINDLDFELNAGAAQALRKI